MRWKVSEREGMYFCITKDDLEAINKKSLPDSFLEKDGLKIPVIFNLHGKKTNCFSTNFPGMNSLNNLEERGLEINLGRDDFKELKHGSGLINKPNGHNPFNNSYFSIYSERWKYYSILFDNAKELSQ